MLSLRNHIAHMKPESDAEDSEDSLGVRTIKEVKTKSSKKFKLNPFDKGEDPPKFTVNYLSHDLVGWSVESAIEFINYFYALLGLPAKIDKTQESYKTIP